MDAMQGEDDPMNASGRNRGTKRHAALLFSIASIGYVASAAAMVTGAVADTAADWLAIFVLVVVPPAGIYLFWMLHILPDKAAHKRHHPQRDAIHMLCLLSLVFGGLLWPLAMLWAYVKPGGLRVAVVEPEHLHPIPPASAGGAPAPQPDVPAAGEPS
jgi:hypothetical protein